ncbi:MAG TPA: hypothetical protein VLD59_01430 [Steroidobacteraceae bacterium]|nr:hypothetical protein [Steroidobacteraceae bacterium]
MVSHLWRLWLRARFPWPCGTKSSKEAVVSVPGTFKQALSEPHRAADDPSAHIREWAASQEAAMIGNGAIVARCWILGECSILVGREPVASDGSYRWHLSIAHRRRYPTWDEIKMARYSIPELRDMPLMVQLLPKIDDPGQWTNLHDNCFHLYESTPDIDLERS